jgi:hypothetical protein
LYLSGYIYNLHSHSPSPAPDLCSELQNATQDARQNAT